MSVNRIQHLMPGHWLGADHATIKVLTKVLRSGGDQIIAGFREQFPEEQCWLLVLDVNEWIVQQLLERLPGLAGDDLSAAQAHAERTNGAALVVAACPGDAGTEVARFLAKREEQMQVMCDQLRGHPVMALCLAAGSMSMGPLNADAHPADTERARRQARARRHRR
jgi:hypothetical protein